MKKLLFVLLLAANAMAIPQLINYQGQLADGGGVPLDTTVAITFKVWPTPAGGSPDWTETHPSVIVTDGLFHVLLGSVTTLPDLFSIDRYLGITIGGDTEMIPREQLVSVAHAYRVGTVDGASGGTITSDVIINNRINVGSSNTNAGSFANVLGEYSVASGDYSVVGGGYNNTASGIQSCVAGGGINQASGDYATVSGGQVNVASGGTATIAGGTGNVASDSGATVCGGASNNAYGIHSTVGGGTYNYANNYAFVGGGVENTASGSHGVIGGGYINSASGFASTIGGGSINICTANVSTVGGGTGNVASGYAAVVSGGASSSASGFYATISGGNENRAFDYAATVGGGQFNVARGAYSFIGGGGSATQVDSNSARGEASVIPGGRRNEATGLFSFAAGFRAKAFHDGAFVWSDNNAIDFASTAINQFSVRASGGVHIGTTILGDIGVKLDNGDTAWEVLSDSTTKTNRHAVDTKSILERVSQLPIEEWNYKHQDSRNTHIGPMAQNFHSLFGYGDDDKSISTIDPDGVALAAIQELAKQNEELLARVAKLENIILQFGNINNSTKQ